MKLDKFIIGIEETVRFFKIVTRSTEIGGFMELTPVIKFYRKNCVLNLSKRIFLFAFLLACSLFLPFLTRICQGENFNQPQSVETRISRKIDPFSNSILILIYSKIDSFDFENRFHSKFDECQIFLKKRPPLIRAQRTMERNPPKCKESQ